MIRKGVHQAFSLCREELHNYFTDPKLYIVLLVVFFFLNREFSAELSEMQNLLVTPCFWEVWPYLSCNYRKILVVWCGFFLMISDLPNQGDSLTSFILRTKKWVFALSQQMYILAVSIFYFLMIQLGIYIIFYGKFVYDNEWTGYVKKVLQIIIGEPARITFETRPIPVFFSSSAMFLLIMFFIGMLMLNFNLYVHRAVGYIVVAVLIVFDIVLQIVNLPWANWFSPVTLGRLTGVDLGYNYELPSIPYALTVLAVLIAVLTLWLYRSLKRYDFQKGGSLT